MVGMGYNTVKDYTVRREVSLFGKYPLLSHLNSYGANYEHVYIYMNAVHAAEKENKNG